MLCGGLRPIRNVGHWRPLLRYCQWATTDHYCLSHAMRSSRRWRCERPLGWVSFRKLEHLGTHRNPCGFVLEDTTEALRDLQSLVAEAQEAMGPRSVVQGGSWCEAGCDVGMKRFHSSCRWSLTRRLPQLTPINSPIFQCLNLMKKHGKGAWIKAVLVE